VPKASAAQIVIAIAIPIQKPFGKARVFSDDHSFAVVARGVIDIDMFCLLFRRHKVGLREIDRCAPNATFVTKRDLCRVV
jgi:hypothetical protein